MFGREQFVEWFSLEAVSHSPAKFNPEKLQWLNNQYLKVSDDARLAILAEPFLKADGCDISSGPRLADAVALLKERVNTIEELADAAVYFYRQLHPSDELRTQHYTAEILPAMKALRHKLESVEWQRQALGLAVKEIVNAHGLKMPRLAMPLRVMLTGTPHSPSIDAVLELIGREEVLRRMDSELARYPG
jgi:glutamyl-tRNA synthetase